MANRLDLNDRGSFLDDENQMVIDIEIQNISEHLFQEWNNSNLDEGTFYADYQICLLYGDPELKKQFNEFYNVDPKDELYFEVDNV